MYPLSGMAERLMWLEDSVIALGDSGQYGM